jgi:hypothetical protein
MLFKERVRQLSRTLRSQIEPVADEPFDCRLLDRAIVLLHVLQEVAAVVLVDSAALIGDENGALTLERHSQKLYSE